MQSLSTNKKNKLEKVEFEIQSIFVLIIFGNFLRARFGLQ